MRIARFLTATMLATALALAGCATGKLSEAEQLALYRSHAGPPVDSFLYLGRINGWTPLGEEALVVWTKPAEAYLLEMRGLCPDLDFAQAISLTHQFGRVYARFDKVIPRVSGNPNPIPCHIGEIRPLDVKALKAAQKDMRRQDGA